ncbi:glycosyltransferase [Prevotella sp. E9-3]|uniref:glycosyltransferase family 4 protein n=1 Tax=Prevotella sp. E9-3 TaxID=2913621 RepID=UPI001EDA2946|nr:glycosyltransferase [Prevotella sp. E9-3]UKK47600.1 glycosyltransferase [Prevotella sp. E9-3]
MKILWLTKRPGLLKKNVNRYNGGGWVDSLQELFMKVPDVKLALTYLTSKNELDIEEDGVLYYPIYKPPKNTIQKWLNYYNPSRNVQPDYLDRIQQIIYSFKPDIIHVFGMENVLSQIIGKTEVPVVVHIQGVVGPIANSFWPSQINRRTLMWPLSKSETIIKNGFGYLYDSMCKKAIIEEKQYKLLKYAMGRTVWDKEMSSLFSEKLVYFHVDELLRPIFYENAGRWVIPSKHKCRIISTISDTLYKGFDVIMKSAMLLKKHASFDFEWVVAGLNDKAKVVKLFERELGVKCKDLNIRYLGVLDAQSLVAELMNSSVYIHPSYTDNSPNSLCEAQMLGLPVIASYVGGIPSLIEDNQDGMLVAVNDPYAVAAKIILLQSDLEFTSIIGKNASKAALLRHDKNKILMDIMNCYSEILKNK